MRRIALALIPALALAACSGGNDAAPVPTESASADAIVSDIPTSAPPASESIAPAAAATTPAGTIPAAIHGRWGMVPGDCTSTRGDAKGLLVIDGTNLKFYESVGKLGTVAESYDTRLRADFAFTGEGMNWTRDQVLDVQDGGKTLIRREYGQDAAPGPFKYTRCA